VSRISRVVTRRRRPHARAPRTCRNQEVDQKRFLEELAMGGGAVGRCGPPPLARNRLLPCRGTRPFSAPLGLRAGGLQAHRPAHKRTKVRTRLAALAWGGSSVSATGHECLLIAAGPRETTWQLDSSCSQTRTRPPRHKRLLTTVASPEIGHREWLDRRASLRSVVAVPNCLWLVDRCGIASPVRRRHTARRSRQSAT